MPVFDGDQLDLTPSLAESAVRAADRESPETERQRTGAERPEEGDGRDEGRLEEFYFRLYVIFCINFSQTLAPSSSTFLPSGLQTKFIVTRSRHWWSCSVQWSVCRS